MMLSVFLKQSTDLRTNEFTYIMITGFSDLITKTSCFIMSLANIAADLDLNEGTM